VVELFRPLALGVVEDLLAEAEGFGRHFQVLVLGQVFEASLKAMLQGRAELDAFAVPLGAHVGEMFGFAGVDHHVGGSGVFSHDHAGIDLFLGSNEERSTLL